MKNLILGTFVALISLTASAVINKKTNHKVSTSYYGNLGGGTYELLTQYEVDPSYCFGNDANPCVYSSEETPVASFTLGGVGQPTDLVNEGADERLFNYVDQ